MKNKIKALAVVLISFVMACSLCACDKNVLTIENNVVIGYKSIKAEEVAIPDGVTMIGERAFEDCEEVTKVVIPDGVTEIGAYAFSDCTNLASIEIPDSVTEIGARAFSGCTNLTSIEIPDGIAKIEQYTFASCESLTDIEIPDGVTEIEVGAFAYCTGLTSVKIPDSVTTFGGFEGCTMTSIEIPYGVTEIGPGAFQKCDHLANIEIPSSVTKIGPCAFFGCTRLTAIDIPDGVTEIDEWVFFSCVNLADVRIPDSVRTINNYAFENCVSIKNVTIHKGFAESTDKIFRWSRNSIHFNFSDGNPVLPDASEEEKLCWTFTESAPYMDIVGHYTDDWGVPVSLTIYPKNDRINDVRIVSLKMLDEPKDGVYFEADSVLLDVGTLEPGQGVVVEVCLADMPIRGIAFDSYGNHVYALQKSGEDGSLVISDQGIRQDSFLYEGQDQDSLKVFFAGCEPFNMETVASYGGAENLLFTTFGQISDFNIVSLNWYNIETGQKEDQCEIGWDWEESHYCTIGEQLLHVDSISQGQAVLVTENVKNPFDNTLPTWGVTYTDIFGVKHAKAYAGSGGNHEYSLIIVSEDIHPKDR